MNVEICCADIESIYAAKYGGATRVELCTGISDGGLTPPVSMVEAARDLGIPEVNALIRTRPGDFVYSDYEISAMCKDACSLVSSGATGIVIGALTPEGDVDVEAIDLIMSTLKSANTVFNKSCRYTFHRAIDLCRDWRRAFDILISRRFDTVLTSGQAANAMLGTETLREMVKYAGGRLKIMAGCGVNADNADEIIDTGVDLIHSTARRPVQSRMKFRRENVPMGNAGADEYTRLTTSVQSVAQLVAKK